VNNLVSLSSDIGPMLSKFHETDNCPAFTARAPGGVPIFPSAVNSSKSLVTFLILRKENKAGSQFIEN